jgi:hypothetical protein
MQHQILKQVLADNDNSFTLSDVLAWLGLKAVALAWLSTAQAFEISRPGQSCQ